jgi:hypothetical protein
MAKIHEEMLGNSEVLKSRLIELKNRSIEIVPKVDRSIFSRSIEIPQKLLLQKRTRTPNQELLHDKKQSSL